MSNNVDIGTLTKKKKCLIKMRKQMNIHTYNKP